MNESNCVKCRALLSSLAVPISAAAKVLGISRPLLSRVLSGDGRVDSERVWALL